MRQAMILAAGRGERMRPLTDTLPKPLLVAGGKPLLQYHLENLAQAGIDRVVINHARLGTLIETRFGNGRAYGLEIVYSPEGEEPLETGGGIKKALPLLAPGPFLLVNADIWTDYPFSRLPDNPDDLGHLVLVHNPDHHPQGDFSLVNGRVTRQNGVHYTYSGIGVYQQELLSTCTETIFSLAPVLRTAAAGNRLTGEVYAGRWLDVGTPERLERLDQMLRTK